MDHNDEDETTEAEALFDLDMMFPDQLTEDKLAEIAEAEVEAVNGL